MARNTRKVIYVSQDIFDAVKDLAAGKLNEELNVSGFDGMPIDQAAQRIIQIFFMERREQRADFDKRGRK